MFSKTTQIKLPLLTTKLAFWFLLGLSCIHLSLVGQTSSHCNIVYDSVNTDEAVELRIGYVEPFYFELELKNPNTHITQFGFELPDVEITGIRLLTENNDVYIEYNDDRVAVCLKDSIKAQDNFMPLLGIYCTYNAPTDIICAPNTARFINNSKELVKYEPAGFCAILECPDAYDGIDGDTWDGETCGDNPDDSGKQENASIFTKQMESLTVYPIPSEDFLKLNFIYYQTAVIDLKVYNIIGQLVEAQTHSVIAGINTIEIDLKDYGKGNYFLHLSNLLEDGEVWVRRFVRK